MRPDPNVDAITLGQVFDATISGNVVLNAGFYGVWATKSGLSRVTLEQNVVIGGITAGAYLQGATDVLVRENLFADNVGPGLSFFPVNEGIIEKILLLAIPFASFQSQGLFHL